jgi:hypothetical protein
VRPVDRSQVELVQLVASVDEVVVGDGGLERKRSAHRLSLQRVYGFLNT